ncbi:MAG TPA: SRPBCC domain-containing protein, partial [Xanthomonadales bacterium]|nr:SRPBCC domain-containing protein [Xanthomonadales bacterium]
YLSDTQVRISRVIRGSVEQVWRAHHEPELLQRWLLGPDGWAMKLCEVATRVGDAFRYEWEQVSDGEQFGFTGQLLESEPPHREVFTEALIGMEGSTTNELTLTPVAGGTLLCLVVTYASADMRDQVLATGMVDGMEASYARLEREVLPAD